MGKKVKLLFTMGTGTGCSLVLPYPVHSYANNSHLPQESSEANKVLIRPMVLPSETWCTFQSVDESNERQSKLGKYMFSKMKTKSSLLKFCKGPAILSLYQFMKEQHPELYNEKVLNGIKKSLKSKEKGKSVTQQECITYAAVNEMDPLSTMTVDFLIEMVGQSLQKLALTALPMGGIYLGGGVTNYLSSYIDKKQDIFWKYFLGNGGMRESVLEKIPIYIMKENPTLEALEMMIIATTPHKE